MTGFEIAAIVGAGASLATGAASTISASKMNRRAQRYAERENELNRNFQSAQAAMGRQWQEDMYQKYYSPSAQMAQFRDAGINPAQAYGQITGTGGMSSPSPSGGSSLNFSQENPWQNAMTSVNNAYDNMLSVMRQKNETERLGFETQLMKAQAADHIASSLLKGQQAELTKKQGDKIDKEIEEIGKNMSLTEEQIKKVKQEVVNLKYDASIKGYTVRLNTAYENLSKQLGMPVPMTEKLLGSIAIAIGALGSGALQAFGNIGKTIYDLIRGIGKGKGKGKDAWLQPSLPLPNVELPRAQSSNPIGSHVRL